jgi:hypothetical protein
MGPHSTDQKLAFVKLASGPCQGLNVDAEAEPPHLLP